MKTIIPLFVLLFCSVFSFAQGPNVSLQLYGYQQTNDLYNNLEFRFINALSLQHHFKPISVYARVGMQQDNSTQINRNVDSFSSTSQEYTAWASESRYLEIGIQRYVNITNSDFRALFRLGGYWASFELESPPVELIGYRQHDYTFTRKGTKAGVSSSLGLEYAIANRIYVQVESQVVYSVRNSEVEIINTDLDPDSYPKSSIESYSKKGFSFSPLLVTVGIRLWNK